MKLKFTRKTWYFFLLMSACFSMANGLAILSGMDLSFLEFCAFCVACISVLFLAAEKGAPTAEKRSYCAVFGLQMVSYLFSGPGGLICSALVWPLLLTIEQRRGAKIAPQLSLVLTAELLHLALLLGALYASFGEGLHFFVNLLWALLAFARGWAALLLYRAEEDA